MRGVAQFQFNLDISGQRNLSYDCTSIFAQNLQTTISMCPYLWKGFL